MDRQTISSSHARLLDLAAALIRNLDGTIAFWSAGCEIQAEMLASGSWAGELTHIRKDGLAVITATRWALDRGEDGAPQAILEIDHDITAYRRHGDAFYRRIVETAHEGVWVADLEGRTVLVNDRLADMLGYSSDEMTGRPVTDFVFADDLREGRERRCAGKTDPPFLFAVLRLRCTM